MKINLSHPIRFILAAAALILWFLTVVVFGVWDKASHLFAFTFAFVYGVFAAGLVYGIWPVGSTVKATKEAQKYTSRNQPGASSYQERSIGYWIWCLILGIGLIGILAWHYHEL